LVAIAFRHAEMGGKRLTPQYRTINLPEDICVETEKWMAGRFDNLESLLTFLLRELANNDAAKLDQAEEGIVEQRLRDLGYI
jgi:hypothetical protein